MTDQAIIFLAAAFVIASILIAIAVGLTARLDKNRSFGLWFMLSFIFTPLVMVVLLILPKVKDKAKQKSEGACCKKSPEVEACVKTAAYEAGGPVVAPNLRVKRRTEPVWNPVMEIDH